MTDKPLIRLPEEDYDAAGLFKFPRTGVWTSSWGDEVARDIMSGRIPREEALAMNKANTREQQKFLSAKEIAHYYGI
jgi:hypothetical protein